MKALLLVSLLFLASCSTAPKCEDRSDRAACQKEQSDQMRMDRIMNRANRNI